jgi:hypothetical protein
MTKRYGIFSPLLLAACIAGCTSAPRTTPGAVVRASAATPVTAERVRNAVTIGQSTKSDVAAALGSALVVTFESGYEVWVYRLARDRSAQETRGRREPTSAESARAAGNPEFVILFAPSGIVAKTRLRLAPEGA